MRNGYKKWWMLMIANNFGLLFFFWLLVGLGGKTISSWFLTLLVIPLYKHWNNLIFYDPFSCNLPTFSWSLSEGPRLTYELGQAPVKEVWVWMGSGHREGFVLIGDGPHTSSSDNTLVLRDAWHDSVNLSLICRFNSTVNISCIRIKFGCIVMMVSGV